MKTFQDFQKQINEAVTTDAFDAVLYKGLTNITSYTVDKDKIKQMTFAKGPKGFNVKSGWVDASVTKKDLESFKMSADEFENWATSKGAKVVPAKRIPRRDNSPMYDSINEQIVVPKFKLKDVRSIENARGKLKARGVKWDSESDGRGDIDTGSITWRMGNKVVASWDWSEKSPNDETHRKWDVTIYAGAFE